ncbi:MAG: aconitate hydratase AcnA [Deltaproteobacteria bacterium]
MDKKEFARTLSINGADTTYYDIGLLEKKGLADIGRLPFSIKILVENLLRKLDGVIVKEQNLMDIARWRKRYDHPVEIPFHPARVLMQDFTGVPAVVDLAAMRDAMKALGDDPKKINPLVPVDLIVDHSVQIDFFGTAECQRLNVAKEYERNSERYALLKWAQQSFDNFSVVPPRSGICHQVNLEYLGKVIIAEGDGPLATIYPDTLVGTDSHTTMINSVGVMGWGVGGIEAEAVMLGQPYYMSIPEVIGVHMTGKLKPGVTATDLVLSVTQMLREVKVVEKFVEFFGPGMKALTVPDRATIANMSPEYGATMGFFPVDEKTLDYLRMTHRSDQAEIVAACTRSLGLFYTGDVDPDYSDVLELDLSTVTPAIAGPARPQDRIELQHVKEAFAGTIGCEYKRDASMSHFSTFIDESGSETKRAKKCTPVNQRQFDLDLNGRSLRIGDGSLVIAAITSCTNTSNPSVMLGAGLLARNAVKKGLRVSPIVKTSLAPGSKVVIRYLEEAGLLPYLEALGFHTAGFGCTTCIGNSGPLHSAIEKAISDNDLNVAAILSGNRNFEARIHQKVKSNFLASPMLVVAFALAGRIDIDLYNEPVGIDPNGTPVYLNELWPTQEQIEHVKKQSVKPEFFRKEYERIFDGDENWQNLKITESTTYAWEDMSTYIKLPPYFDGFSKQAGNPPNIENARALLLLGDTITTDHISPAGAIPEEYPAGQYLIAQSVKPKDFNSYGSRRGNHEVMMRGTFGNIRIKNQLVKPKEGSFTLKFPEKEERFVYDAAMTYLDQEIPLIVLGGKEYGTGSSRDWAAKGTSLLGVRAVIAESYERIHRSNLVGMGVLPLIFTDGDSWQSLGIDGSETFFITGVQSMQPQKRLQVKTVKNDGQEIDFSVTARLDTEVDVEYFRHGGILQYVLRRLLKQ